MTDFLTELGVAVLLPRDELMGLIRSAPHRYKVYTIEKRTKGQFRTIAQPAREVKRLQYWVLENVLSQFEIHPAATGYRQGLSIADNAKPHTRGKFLLKLDFKDFFPSLKAHDLRVFLKRSKTQLVDADIDALCRILFWRPKGTRELRLSIGAPTSPMLSNILMIDFDRRVSASCEDHKVAYTRYADDLTFSAEDSDQLRVAEKTVLEFCRRSKSPALTVNHEKTVRVSKRDARRVTGLVLTNDQKVSLGHDEKRRIRAWVHHFVTNRLDEKEVLRLKGMLAYINSVEPQFIQRLCHKYGAETIGRLQTGQ